MCGSEGGEAIWFVRVRRAVDIWDLSHDEAVGVNHWLSSEAQRRKISWQRKRMIVEGGKRRECGCRASEWHSFLFLLFGLYFPLPPRKRQKGRYVLTKRGSRVRCKSISRSEHSKVVVES